MPVIDIHNWEGAMVDVSRAQLTSLDTGIFDWRPVEREILNHGRSLCLSVEHTERGGAMIHGKRPGATARICSSCDMF